MLHLHAIECIVKPVELKSRTAAAKSLKLPKSNIRSKIKNLEERVGMTPLTRTRRASHLTEAGRLCFEKSALALKELKPRKRRHTFEPGGDQATPYSSRPNSIPFVFLRTARNARRESDAWLRIRIERPCELSSNAAALVCSCKSFRMNRGARANVCEHFSVVYFVVEAYPERKSLKNPIRNLLSRGWAPLLLSLNMQDLAGRPAAKGLPLEGNGIQTPRFEPIRP
jgi:hypothetical protein